MPATMAEVAALAGVSIKTVSNVINDRPHVTSEVRERVQAAIAELAYRPNRAAQALRSRHIHSLAAIIPDIRNPFFAQVVRGIEDAAFSAGLMLFVCNTEDDAGREARYLEGLSSGTIAGAVLCAADPRLLGGRVAALQAARVAVVLLDRVAPGLAVDAVLSDNEGGSRMAVRHLLAAGHRRIGVIAGPPHFSLAEERLNGYLRSHADLGLAPAPDLVCRTDFRQESAPQATRALLGASQPPSALFICSGSLALGALKTIQDCGLRVPRDLALVVFDDPDWSEVVAAPLTVVAQPAYEMGRRAAELLLSRIEQPGGPYHTLRLPTHFIHRRSCCRAEQEAA